MNKEPASIFATDNDLTVAPGTARPSPEQVRAVAQESNFRSREASAPAPAIRPVPWRYRTGRDVQFNVKVSQATREGFEALAMRLNRPKGELVERALAALEREVERELAGRG